MIEHTQIEVRYQETDQMGVVYHANYLIWFEIGRTKFIESLGVKYVHMEQEGYLVPVLDASIQYKKPVRYGDEVTIQTSLVAYSGVRFTYHYEILVNDEVYVSGQTKHAVVRKADFKPVSLKRERLDWHERYKAALSKKA